MTKATVFPILHLIPILTNCQISKEKDINFLAFPLSYYYIPSARKLTSHKMKQTWRLPTQWGWCHFNKVYFDSTEIEKRLRNFIPFRSAWRRSWSITVTCWVLFLLPSWLPISLSKNIGYNFFRVILVQSFLFFSSLSFGYSSGIFRSLLNDCGKC